ncbi:MAG TPA: PQQ-binding-like beta-propeller repeat protein [Opitutus sp.]|nr:PQQ-binding-like beta-propeller repeat protein [Opitutus sp.]
MMAARHALAAAFLLPLALATFAASAFAAASTAPDPHRSWRDYGGGPDQSKYVVTDAIDKTSVARLVPAWTYRTDDAIAYQTNPIVIDGVMFVMAKHNSLVALDAATGRELWIHANLRGLTRRGLNYWQNADGTDRRLLFAINNRLQAIDARTGLTVESFGDHGVVDLRAGLGRDLDSINRVQSGTPGRIFENLIILGSSPGEGYVSPPGHIRAYDVVTGKLAWTFHTIPQPGEFGYDTWPPDAWKYAGGANAWGEMTLDEKRGIVFIPLGSPTYDYYGADRIGANLFGTCLVALDARTGRRLWHFQFVHHDLWDYDPTAAPQLVTIHRDGKTVDAVAQATKTGFLFVFDRVTGEPVFPIKERPVMPSDVPGEQAWPTQPFPAALPPFARQIFTSDDLTPYLLTPEERAAWTKRIDTDRKGLFVPPSLERETVTVPGAVGGSNWGNTAADPRRGLVFVLNQDFPSFYRLEKVETEQSRDGAPPADLLERSRELYAENCSKCHGADRAGSLGPPLLDLGKRLDFEDFYGVILSGRGQMPAFTHIDFRALYNLYLFLGGTASGPAAAPGSAAAKQNLPAGPVVGSGPAPGTYDDAPSGPRFRSWAATPYPEGAHAPAVRYTTGYGLGFPYLMRPPWSYLVAYDLNAGVIKWKVPVGEDRDAAREGAKNTGVPRGAQRNGMIVTSTGVVFSTAKDGRIYAFDTDTGRTLWSADLGCGTEGLPAMYELDGRPYLVVNATTPLTWGRNSRESGIGAARTKDEGGYIVFSLPPTKS